MDPITIALLLAVVVLGTKTGRGAVSNGVRSGYKATGWRTPGQAIIHHTGKGGAWIGRWTAKGARAARTGIVERIKDRWHRSRKADTAPVDAVEPSESPPLDPVTFPDFYRTYGDGAPPGGPNNGMPSLEEHRRQVVEERERLIKEREQAEPAKAVEPVAPPTVVPSTTRRPIVSRGSSRMSRLSINLEKPTSDAEFLEDCQLMADTMRILAEQVSEWAQGVAALGLPTSVTEPLNAIGEGLSEAAAGAARAATRFEEEFEDARDVAAKGMIITGQDAA